MFFLSFMCVFDVLQCSDVEKCLVAFGNEAFFKILIEALIFGCSSHIVGLERAFLLW